MDQPQEPATSKSEIIIFLVIAAAIVFGVWKFVSPLFAGDTGAPSTEVETVDEMGSGQTCNRKLSARVTENYLLNHGLEVADSDAATIATGGAVAEVCQNGPPSLSVEAGAQQVVQILKEDL